MVKKEARKSAKIIKASSSDKLNAILIENFVNLQKAMTNLTVKFDKLADQISSLLQLFEISARSFAEKLATGAPEIEKDKEFLDKLNTLLEQNKVIAKGLTLMEEKIRGRLYGERPAPKPVARARIQPSPYSPRYGYIPSRMEEKEEGEARTEEIE